jgi:preprotein translocase subunit SecF
VVAALPVAAILFIGAAVLGAGTLRDIALSLLVGILIGTYSTIFIAAPLYAQLRENEPELAKRTVRVTTARAAGTTGAVR